MSRAFLKQFVPPVIINFLHRNSRPLFFNSWDAAESAQVSGGYENPEIAELVSYKTAYQLEHGLSFTLSAMQTISAIGIILSERKSSSLSVLDIGGGCGMHYHQARRCFPGVDFNWTVLESEAMVKAGQAGAKIPGLAFCSSVESFKGYDFIHSSGTLGFIKGGAGILKQILESECPYILLSRIAVTDEPDEFVVLHRHPLGINGPGNALPAGFIEKTVAYPARIFQQQQLLDTLQKNDEYEMAFTIEDIGASFIPGRRVNEGYFMLRKRNMGKTRGALWKGFAGLGNALRGTAETIQNIMQKAAQDFHSQSDNQITEIEPGK